LIEARSANSHMVVFCFLEIIASHCGLGVAVAWLTSALSGQWQPVPRWLDWIGIALGIFWLGIIPFFNLPWTPQLKA
jgi:hypothetical protein